VWRGLPLGGADQWDGGCGSKRLDIGDPLQVSVVGLSGVGVGKSMKKFGLCLDCDVFDFSRMLCEQHCGPA
jgi:hypothetical protein